MQKFSLSTVAAGAIVSALFAGQAVAQDKAGRYTMHKADDGFVRLDTQSGAMSLCRKSDDAWACQPMAGSDKADQRELAKLRRENAELREQIKQLGSRPAGGGSGAYDPSDPPRPGARPGGEKSSGLRLPTEKEVDQALNYFENILKKFQDRLKRLERNQEDPETKPL